jgi:phosphoadenosine phosphosulfate reductase
MEQLKKLEEFATEHSIEDTLAYLSSLFPGAVKFSSSLGQEDQVITDMIWRNKIDVEIFTLDTGRLFPETYDLIERTGYRYNKEIKIYFPQAEMVQQLVQQNGINGFYHSVENRISCCAVRKIEPLNRALQGTKVWVTGIRSEQSENRSHMPLVEWNEERQLYKFNPLLHWTYDEVLNYIEKYHVPYNKLHDKGFISIGCAPCTRAIEPGEDPRAGRWWWEASKKECGLHVSTIGK